MVEEECICFGKRAYDKKGAITASNKRFHEDHVRLRIYPCNGHWHLTKQLRGTWLKHGKKIIKE